MVTLRSVRVPIGRAAACLASFIALGCGGRVVEVDGVSVYEAHWLETQEQVGRRASFELDCPPEQLRFMLFQRLGRQPSEVGVEGCGRREVYTRVGSTWFSGGQGREGAAAQQQLIQQQQQQQYYQQQ